METEVISDEALMAFVEWCRIVNRKIINDPALVRRVFEAYAGLSEDPKVITEARLHSISIDDNGLGHIEKVD